MLTFTYEGKPRPRPLAQWLVFQSRSVVLWKGLEGSLAFGWKGNVQGLLQAFEQKIPMDGEEGAPVRAAMRPPCSVKEAEQPGETPSSP